MADLAENRIVSELSDAHEGQADILAATKGYIGVLSLLDEDGYLGAPADGVYCAGVNAEPPSIDGYDNSEGATGDRVVRFYRRKAVPLEPSASDAPGIDDIGRPVFAEDNQTVGLEPFHLTRKRPFVGRVKEVLSSQIVVELDPAVAPAKSEMGDSAVAPVQTLAAATALVINDFQSLYPLVSDSGAVTLTADLPGGNDGQEMTLMGTDDTDYVNLTSGISNLELIGDVACAIKANDGIDVVYNGTVWREKGRFVG